MELLTEKLQALADKDRLRIIQLLVDCNCCIHQLEEKLNLDPNIIIDHLQILHDAHLISINQETQRVTSELRKDTVFELIYDLEKIMFENKTCC